MCWVAISTDMPEPMAKSSAILGSVLGTSARMRLHLKRLD